MYNIITLMQRFLLFKKPLMIFVQVCICDMKGKIITMASLVAQLKKKPPAMQETTVQFLGWEDPLEGALSIPTNTSSGLASCLLKDHAVIQTCSVDFEFLLKRLKELE